MTVIYSLLIGVGIFIISTVIVGKSLRRVHSKRAVERITRIMHVILIITVIAPLLFAIFNLSENIYNFDQILNIQSLPFPSILTKIGVVMIIIGVVVMVVAQTLLLGFGDGLALLSLSKKLTVNVLYERSRNPMILGDFLIGVGLGLLTGSTFFTLFMLLVYFPAIIFWLKYVEEYELEMRFGESYKEYKQQVPFLIPTFRRISNAH